MKINEIVYFCNEYDLLEAHLDTHAPYVEKFFVAESEVTVSGLPKPLFFEMNKERYSRFNIEHIIIPPDLQPKTEGWPDFRIQDHEKNKYVHPIASEGCDWVQHSDIDEIIKPHNYAKGLLILDAHPEWKHSCYHLKQAKTYVNCKQCKVHVYRFVKANPGQYEEGPKGTPRGTFKEGQIGWHFHNCFSNADEFWWKCLNRNWFFGGWDNVPTLEDCEWLLDRLGTTHAMTDDDFLNIASIHQFIGDTPEVMEKRARPILWLPQWMQDNIERFPYYERTRKDSSTD